MGALLSSTMVAFSPHLISMSSYLLTEILFSFTLLAAFTCYIYACEKDRCLLFGLSGLFFGYAYLTNEIALFLPLLMVLTTYLYCKKVSIGKPLPKQKFLLVFLLVFFLFPGGWMVRNTLSVPAGSIAGKSRALSTLSHGAYPDFLYKNKAFKYFPYREDPDQPFFSSSLKNFSEIFGQRFREKPLRYLSWYLFEKPYYLW